MNIARFCSGEHNSNVKVRIIEISVENIIDPDRILRSFIKTVFTEHVKSLP